MKDVNVAVSRARRTATGAVVLALGIFAQATATGAPAEAAAPARVLFDFEQGFPFDKVPARDVRVSRARGPAG